MQPPFKAFTLIELMIVIPIIGIIVLLVMSLSGTQLQNLQQKVVKERILSTYQSYYSKNLTSSYFAGSRYETMHLFLEQEGNAFTFNFIPAESNDNDIKGNFDLANEKMIFSDRFVIENILTNPRDLDPTKLAPKQRLTITYNPYEISCTIRAEETAESREVKIEDIVLITKIREMKTYCFMISTKSCRMKEVACLDQWSKDVNLNLKTTLDTYYSLQ